MPFTRMDQMQPEEVEFLGEVFAQRQAAMPGVIKAMLRQLDEQVEGMSVTQLEHSLQTATRTLRAGAPEELIVAALCHDLAEVICDVNHGAIAAEILKPYVSLEACEVVRTHQDFQGRYIYALIGKIRMLIGNMRTSRGSSWPADFQMNGTRPRSILTTTCYRLPISNR